MPDVVAQILKTRGHGRAYKGLPYQEREQCLATAVEWVVHAAFHAPQSQHVKAQLRDLLAIDLFTLALTRGNFADLRSKISQKMTELGKPLASLPPDAEGVDLEFGIPKLMRPDLPRQVAQTNDGILPSLDNVPVINADASGDAEEDWGETHWDFQHSTKMHESVFIRVLILIAIAVEGTFHAKIRALGKTLFGDDFEGFHPAAVKSFGRMYAKLLSYLDHRGESMRPRPALNVDVVRCLVAVQTTRDIGTFLALLAQRFGGFAKVKNKYLLSEQELREEYNLRLVLVSVVYDMGCTYGDLVEAPETQRRWEEYARPGSAHADGEPESRRRRHIAQAVRWLRSPSVAGVRVRMLCEVQVCTTATACVRGRMHELFRIYRSCGKVALYKDYNTAKPQDPCDLRSAARHGELDAVCKYLPVEDVDAADDDGFTALCLAAACGHPDVVGALVQAKADVNKANNKGASPVYFASERGAVDVVRVLVEAQADVNQVRDNGHTALFHAASRGLLDVCAVLIKAQADMDAAVALCERLNDLEARALLEQCRASL